MFKILLTVLGKIQEIIEIKHSKIKAKKVFIRILNKRLIELLFDVRIGLTQKRTNEFY